MAKTVHPGDARETLSVECACGGVHTGNFGHYQEKVFPCRRAYWALRPVSKVDELGRRYGQLVLMPYPGGGLRPISGALAAARAAVAATDEERFEDAA